MELKWFILASLLLMGSLCLGADLDAFTTASWATLFSATLAVDNNKTATVDAVVLASPGKHSSQPIWMFGVVQGPGMANDTNQQNSPCTFGIFQVDPGTTTTWEWAPINSTDIASATVSFSSGSELQLIVDWRNGSSGNVAWSSGTGEDAYAAALTDDGQLLLLDSGNNTIWQRPGTLALAKNASDLSPCPSNVCLLPPPPPPPPSTPSSHPASDSTSVYPPLSLALLISVISVLVI